MPCDNRGFKRGCRSVRCYKRASGILEWKFKVRVPIKSVIVYVSRSIYLYVACERSMERSTEF